MLLPAALSSATACLPPSSLQGVWPTWCAAHTQPSCTCCQPPQCCGPAPPPPPGLCCAHVGPHACVREWICFRYICASRQTRGCMQPLRQPVDLLHLQNAYLYCRWMGGCARRGASGAAESRHAHPSQGACMCSHSHGTVQHVTVPPCRPRPRSHACPMHVMNHSARIILSPPTSIRVFVPQGHSVHNSSVCRCQ